MAQGKSRFSCNRNLYPSTQPRRANGPRRGYLLAGSAGSRPLPRPYAAEPLEPRLLLAVLYVDLSAPGPLHDGSSWDSAYADLQPALGNAVSGDEIRIAAGTYKPTADADRTQSFQLKGGVALYGGYAGHNAANPDQRDIQRFPTILSGEIGDPATNSDNSYHVVYASAIDATSILDGVTITAGNAYGTSIPNDRGGGMYVASSHPILINCTFSGNWARYGGGMANSSSSPALINCTFSGNSTVNFGGGMHNSSSSPTLTNCTFNGNSASSGGGGMYNNSSSPMLANCSFSGTSAIEGGGVYNTSHSSSTLTNCTFTGNSAQNNGGGLYNGSSSPTLTNCTFSANSGTSSGGGLYDIYSSPTLTNCSFSANSARHGGGLYNISSSAPTLTNCIFTGNSAGDGGGVSNWSCSPTLTNCTFTGNTADYGGGLYNGSSSPTLTNCILWGNTGKQMLNAGTGGTPAITYSLIPGGYTGTGILDTDPQFLRNPSPGPDGKWGTADDDYGDLRLRSTSPALNAGSNAALPSDLTTDLMGKLRLVGGTVDLGACEYQNDELILAGLTADSFHLRISGSTLEIFRNTQPDQSQPSQSISLSSLSRLRLQGGHYTLASNLAGLELDLESDSQVRLASSQRLAFLSLSPTATLDLADHDLIVSATPETKQAVLAAIASSIKSARGSDGQWLGTGLSS
ncbi:MAG TPA: right-handed parallel beta-helix repeat-containing protein, partial [Tepidisphaeraceae bacterium]|nr:right-handed parallel beta-helix repeat-containing protein [Tepidisphaeraceae bacterium]